MTEQERDIAMVEVEKKPLAGLIEVSLQSSISSATKLFSTYPLRILHPKKVQFDASVDCAWFYTVSYGGGLVSGDLVPMSVDVQKNCTASVCTQGTTKVYKSIKPSSTNGTEESGQQQRDGIKTTKQTLEAKVGTNALLCWLPDPAQCFKDAKFEQVHEISLQDDSSSLCFVDWITAGRVAHDNARWAFRMFSTKTTVTTGDDNVNVIESQRLENSSSNEEESLAKRMANAHVIASVILIGPRTEGTRRKCAMYAKESSKRIMNAASWLTAKSPLPAGVSYSLATASESKTQRMDEEGDKKDCLVLRVLASDIESAYVVLRECLQPLEVEIGCPPYNERGGS